MHETLSSFPEQFGDGPRKPEIKPEILKEMDRTADNLKCGWFWFRPLYLQRFRTAKWALFWLCWAGAMQGTVSGRRNAPFARSARSESNSRRENPSGGSASVCVGACARSF